VAWTNLGTTSEELAPPLQDPKNLPGWPPEWALSEGGQCALASVSAGVIGRIVSMKQEGKCCRIPSTV
jgi:hypothetical protein